MKINICISLFICIYSFQQTHGEPNEQRSNEKKNVHTMQILKILLTRFKCGTGIKCKADVSLC